MGNCCDSKEAINKELLDTTIFKKKHNSSYKFNNRKNETHTSAPVIKLTPAVVPSSFSCSNNSVYSIVKQVVKPQSEGRFMDGLREDDDRMVHAEKLEDYSPTISTEESEDFRAKRKRKKERNTFAGGLLYVEENIPESKQSTTSLQKVLENGPVNSKSSVMSPSPVTQDEVSPSFDMVEPDSIDLLIWQMKHNPKVFYQN